MKQGLTAVVACCGLWCGMALAGDTASSYFANAYKECDKLYQADQAAPSASGQFSREACYSYQVRVALADNAANRNEYFAAALKSAPEYVAQTFDAALDAGFDQYEAITVATTAYPKGEATYAQRAISYGADPAMVTEATAAGYKKK
ncbi:hypothetical protein HPT27_09235 [Permianibacter sp. IMCC34836]|uniref:hypothetical protein n=1 Tax=Permianibacter fluminis TaxID=2738515 RepID=UPI00155576F2|nr:hypothetical protein [Permianibacter fluminis]NQD37209.1 hypothetical protein [Permianibacter fluminis]